jgi:hypothetical protein
MANTVYKSTSYKAIESRTIAEADTTKNTQINNTLATFFTFFKEKHL